MTKIHIVTGHSVHCGEVEQSTGVSVQPPILVDQYFGKVYIIYVGALKGVLCRHVISMMSFNRSVL